MASQQEILDKLAASSQRLAYLESELATNKKLMLVLVAMAFATVILNKC